MAEVSVPAPKTVVTAVVWSTATPLLFAAAGRAIGLYIGDAAWWLLIPAPLIMGFVGGLLVSHERWYMVLVMAALGAGVFALAVLVIGVALTPTDCPPRPRSDCATEAYGIGAVTLFVVAALTLLPGLALGRAASAKRAGPQRAF